MPVRVERIVKECLNCGTKFEVLPGKKRSAKKYCCFECSVIIRRTLPECECVNCGNKFQPKFADRMRYCSIDCKNEFKHNRKMFNKSSSYIDKQSRMQPCIICGTICDYTNATYCSDECRKKQARRKELERNALNKQSIIYTCKVCGKEFTQDYGNKVRIACSIKCLHKHHKAMQRIARHRREERLKGAYVADVHTYKILERDKSMCMLCNQPLMLDVVVPHPLSPTIDHIIPIANGGTHEPNNVQSAHFICNVHKSNRKFNVMKVAKYIWTPEVCKIVNVKPYDYEKNGFASPFK